MSSHQKRNQSQMNLPGGRTPVRVLMLGWELPPYNSGGLGVACEGLTRELAKQNIVIEFVLPYFPREHMPSWMRVHSLFGSITTKEAESLLKEFQITSPYISQKEYAKNIIQNPKSFLFGRSIYEQTRLYARLAPHLAKRLKFDIIHAHDWLTYDAGIAIREATGKPLLTHVHATEYDRTGNSPDVRIKEVELRGLSGADRVLAVSEYTRGILQQVYGIFPERVDVVHNGVVPNVECIHPAVLIKKLAGSPVVLFVGRLTYQKGAEYFLRAAKLVSERRPDVVFIVSGSGDSEHALIEEASRLGLTQRIFFAGFTRGDDLLQLYAHANLYVMPSVSEPFGITALEAAQMGIPVIISKQSGVREVLPNSLSVDFWDTEQLASHMLSVLGSHGLSRTLGGGAILDALKATWVRAAEKTSEIYVRVLGRGT